MAEVLKVLKAISDEVRLRILNLLLNRRFCVCEVQEILNMSEPRVSRHLNILKEAGLVNCEKKGKWCYYYAVIDNENEGLFNYLKDKFKSEDVYRMDLKRAGKINLKCDI